MYGIKIQFQSGYDKTLFTRNDDLNEHQGLVHTLIYLKSITGGDLILGNITLAAWQVGGDPEKLSKILPSKSSNFYY